MQETRDIFSKHRGIRLQNWKALGLEDPVLFHSRDAPSGSHLLQPSVSGTPRQAALRFTIYSSVLRVRGYSLAGAWQPGEAGLRRGEGLPAGQPWWHRGMPPSATPLRWNTCGKTALGLEQGNFAQPCKQTCHGILVRALILKPHSVTRIEVKH